MLRNTLKRSLQLLIAAIFISATASCTSVAPKNKPAQGIEADTSTGQVVADEQTILVTEAGDSREHETTRHTESQQQGLNKKLTTASPSTALSITRARRMGVLTNRNLTEVSGMAASRIRPGVLFAVNDSGNEAILYAMNHTGEHLGEWTLDARNRDWEDMASVMIDGKPHLIVGDTGDNLRVHRENSLYVFEEPLLESSGAEPLTPVLTVRYVYDNGPRNVEAFAVAANTVYLISKEPVSPAGPTASRVYELQLPDKQSNRLLTARQIATLPLAASTLETRLAAAIAGVDLNHPTSLDFNAAGNTAYILTYRHVRQVRRAPEQSWAQAFASKATTVHAHDLEQAEALAVSDNIVWFTSENRPAPLWALPALPPL